jgi:hypothetical protein
MMDVWSKQPYSRIKLRYRRSASGQDSMTVAADVKKHPSEDEKTIHDYYWPIILPVEKA